MKTKSLALRFHAKPCLDPTTGVGVCVCHRVLLSVKQRDGVTSQKGWLSEVQRHCSWGFYMASNSSILCFVLPCLICRRVLYLSRPALTFSL